MYCKNCGVEFAKTMKYCPACGKELGKEEGIIENDSSKEGQKQGNSTNDSLMIISTLVTILSGVALIIIPEMAKANKNGQAFMSKWAYTYRWGGEFTLICGGIFVFSLILTIVMYSNKK